MHSGNKCAYVVEIKYLLDLITGAKVKILLFNYKI